MIKRFRIMSAIESKYLPEYEGVFLILASSPSAASRMDFIIKKIAARTRKSLRMQYMAIRPLKINVIVTWKGVKLVFLKDDAITLAAGRP